MLKPSLEPYSGGAENQPKISLKKAIYLSLKELITAV
jgi:hypothetical protein